MLSDLDIFRAAHLMMHEHGGDAELEAAMSADRMLRRGDREELLTWFRKGWRSRLCGTHPKACHIDRMAN
jgi:hypothetical protein